MIDKEKVIQDSEEWFELRLGRPTASRFSGILTPKRGYLSASRWKDMDELIAETFTRPKDMVLSDFEGNKHTDRGTELEPEAREAFCELTNLDVRQVGFVTRGEELWPNERHPTARSDF